MLWNIQLDVISVDLSFKADTCVPRPAEPFLSGSHYPQTISLAGSEYDLLYLLHIYYIFIMYNVGYTVCMFYINPFFLYS